MGKIIVVGSQKGGVGKTTTILNLAYALSKMGKKVMTADFDSQANLTKCYGVEKTDELEYTIGHMLMAQLEDKKPLAVERCIRTSVALISIRLLFIYRRFGILCQRRNGRVL